MFSDDEIREELFYKWKDLEVQFNQFKAIVQNPINGNVTNKDYERFVKNFEMFVINLTDTYKQTKKLVKSQK